MDCPTNGSFFKQKFLHCLARNLPPENLLSQFCHLLLEDGKSASIIGNWNFTNNMSSYSPIPIPCTSSSKITVKTVKFFSILTIFLGDFVNFKKVLTMVHFVQSLKQFHFNSLKKYFYVIFVTEP